MFVFKSSDEPWCFFFFFNPPHSAHSHWFHMWRAFLFFILFATKSFLPAACIAKLPVLWAYCRPQSAFSAAKSPTSLFDHLCSHTQSCQTSCGYEKVWNESCAQWEDSNMADFSLSAISEAIFFFPPPLPPHSPSLIARVNITDFYFPLFTFYYRAVYILFSLIMPKKHS